MEAQARVLAADPVADWQAESVSVLLARLAADSALDSAVQATGRAADRAAGSPAESVADSAARAGEPAELQAAAALAWELLAQAANPLEESPADLVAGPAVDSSDDRTTMRVKMRQR